MNIFWIPVLFFLACAVACQFGCFISGSLKERYSGVGEWNPFTYGGVLFSMICILISFVSGAIFSLMVENNVP